MKMSRCWEKKSLCPAGQNENNFFPSFVPYLLVSKSQQSCGRWRMNIAFWWIGIAAVVIVRNRQYNDVLHPLGLMYRIPHQQQCVLLHHSSETMRNWCIAVSCSGTSLVAMPTFSRVWKCIKHIRQCGELMVALCTVIQVVKSVLLLSETKI